LPNGAVLHSAASSSHLMCASYHWSDHKKNEFNTLNWQNTKPSTNKQPPHYYSRWFSFLNHFTPRSDDH